MYPPFFLLPLGFIIFPYFVILLSRNIKEKYFKFLFYGFAFGFGFLIIYLSWLPNPFLVNTNTSPYAIISILLPIFLSIFFGLVFLIFKYVKHLIFIIFITPFIFIFNEFIISNIFYGFPWVSNSLILSNNFLGFYVIKYFGTLPSGFIILSLFLFPVFIIYKNIIIFSRKILLIVFVPFMLLLIIPIYFTFNNNDKSSKEITVDIHQILSPIYLKDQKKIEDNIIQHIKNSESEYIIFAENNFPYLIEKNNLKNKFNFIKNEKKIIIGATTHKDSNYYNSFLLIEDGQVHFFDKKILVPFGEFLPFRKNLKFMEYISGSTDFKIGKEDRLLITRDNLKILPIICYEIIFEKIFKNINKKKIDILINITNDSWFGDKIGPYQHFYISRTKSLIANKPLIRVSNNGISAIFDNNGKIIEASKLNKISNIKYNLKINNKKSYFYFHQIVSCYLLFIFILILVVSKKKQNEKFL